MDLTSVWMASQAIITAIHPTIPQGYFWLFNPCQQVPKRE